MRKHLTWRPGNGSQYDLFVTRLDAPFGDVPAGSWMIVGPWSPRARIMFLEPVADGADDALQYSRVGREFRVGDHDASIITMMLAPHVGRTAVVMDSVFRLYPGAPAGEPTVVEFP